MLMYFSKYYYFPVSAIHKIKFSKLSIPSSGVANTLIKYNLVIFASIFSHLYKDCIYKNYYVILSIALAKLFISYLILWVYIYNYSIWIWGKIQLASLRPGGWTTAWNSLNRGGLFYVPHKAPVDFFPYRQTSSFFETCTFVRKLTYRVSQKYLIIL